MDSKLLGSNIARYSRYGIVHETVRLFYEKNKGAIEKKLKLREANALREVVSERASAVTYRSTKEELERQFAEMGALVYVLVKSFKGTSKNSVSFPRCHRVALYSFNCNGLQCNIAQIHLKTEVFRCSHKGLEGQREYKTLKRVFEEQYRVEQEEGGKKTVAVPREREEISETPFPRAKSVQSPHDTDCHYRNKNGNEVKGYSINVTETCDKGTVNLLVKEALINPNAD